MSGTESAAKVVESASEDHDPDFLDEPADNNEKKGNQVEPQKKSEFSNMLNKAHLKLQKVPENHFAGMLEEFSTRDPSLYSEVISKGLLQITDAQLMQNVPASVEQSQKTSG
ncbi:hypothetical protein pipiens_015279 [Culex pipiens pipiens]|uniref:Uncharacterized protein n=1 Tax=Culex pipiens pipiens TaxID=38569 RepID=A0ABD1CRC6_CULPP